MSKVALLSLPMTWNYGGILQQFALQEVLGAMGHTTHILCRRQTRPNPVTEWMVSMKWRVVPALGRRLPLSRFPLFAVETFKRDFLRNQSPPCFNGGELLSYIEGNGIDAIVVGSDQVWNKWAVPDLMNYYLDFCKDLEGLTRIAYAPSFSKPEWDYTDEEVAQCRELLARFDALSTREQIGVEHCRQYFDCDVRLMPDPTLLLGADYYLGVAQSRRDSSVVNGRHVFSYILDAGDARKVEAVMSASALLNAEVMQFAKRIIDPHRGGPLTERDQSVENWLHRIATADFVVTDSFHGTVFAIIFNRPFVTFPNVKRGYDRFATLAMTLGVGDRFVFHDSDIDSILRKELDWREINARLANLAKGGHDFLRSALGGGANEN